MKNNDVQNAKAVSEQVVVALVGNPNAGKTTLFNALTGSRQRVSNYPGNTVEFIEKVWRLDGKAVRLVDLPGLYSLDTISDDQAVARNVLKGEYAGLPKPNAVVAVVDATNLKRNLYLVTELLESRIPLVVALTMFDEAEQQEIKIEINELSERLSAPVSAVTASTRRGFEELEEKVLTSINARSAEIPTSLDEIVGLSGDDQAIARHSFAGKIVRECVTRENPDETSRSEKIDRILTHRVFGLPILLAVVFLIFLLIFSVADLPMQFTEYGFFRLGEFVKSALPAETLFRQMLIDGVITGVGGVLVFVWQIALLFLFISILEDVGYLARATLLLDRLMRSFGLNGKAFMPLFSSFACAIPGIMATRTIGDVRDRLITIIIAPFMSCAARIPVYILLVPLLGLSPVEGASVIVAMYLLGIAAAVLVAFALKRTTLKAPLPPLVMELPPYRAPNAKTVLLNVWKNVKMFFLRAGTVILAITIILWALQTFPSDEFLLPELVMMGIVVAVILALAAKRIARLFQPKTVAIKPLAPRRASVSRGLSSLWRSEKLVVATLILAWGLVAYVPKYVAGEWQPSAISQMKSGEESQAEERNKARNSYAGQFGRFIAPVVATLGIGAKGGDDEKAEEMRGSIGFALFASFAAREVFVSAWTISSLGSKEDDPKSPPEVLGEYWEKLQKFWASPFDSFNENEELRREVADANFTPLNALTLMVFFVLAMQCGSTLAVVWRETNSWRLPVLMFFGMTLLAYAAAFLTYRVGSLMGFE